MSKLELAPSFTLPGALWRLLSASCAPILNATGLVASNLGALVNFDWGAGSLKWETIEGLKFDVNKPLNPNFFLSHRCVMYDLSAPNAYSPAQLCHSRACNAHPWEA